MECLLEKNVIAEKRKLINLVFLSQIRDLLPTILLSLAVGAAVYLTVSILQLNSWATFSIGVVEEILLYVGFARLFSFSDFKELLSIIRRKIIFPSTDLSLL